MRDEIRRAGLRATVQRIAVLEVLHATTDALSHGEIAEKLTGLASDRSTIYRNLVDLAEAGLVRRNDMGDHLWRFELSKNPAHAMEHAHFLCTRCGSVACLPALQLDAGRVKKPRTVRDGRFEIQLRGLCDSCARTAKS
jgi:Fur family ferric uptake transcriptional regulator